MPLAAQLNQPGIQSEVTDLSAITTDLLPANHRIYRAGRVSREQLVLGEHIAMQMISAPTGDPIGRLHLLIGLTQIGKGKTGTSCLNYLASEEAKRYKDGLKPYVLVFTSQNQNLHVEQWETDLQQDAHRDRIEDAFVLHPGRAATNLKRPERCRGVWLHRNFGDLLRAVQNGHPLAILFDEDHHGLGIRSVWNRILKALGIEFLKFTPPRIYLLNIGATSWPASLGLPKSNQHQIPRPESYYGHNDLLQTGRIHDVREGLTAHGNISDSAQEFFSRILVNKDKTLLVWCKDFREVEILRQWYLNYHRSKYHLDEYNISIEVYGDRSGKSRPTRRIRDLKKDLKQDPWRPGLKILLQSYGAAMRFDADMSRHLCGVWIGGHLAKQELMENQADLIWQKVGRFTGHSKHLESFPIAAHREFLETCLIWIESGRKPLGTWLTLGGTDQIKLVRMLDHRPLDAREQSAVLALHKEWVRGRDPGFQHTSSMAFIDPKNGKHNLLAFLRGEVDATSKYCGIMFDGLPSDQEVEDASKFVGKGDKRRPRSTKDTRTMLENWAVYRTDVAEILSEHPEWNGKALRFEMTPEGKILVSVPSGTDPILLQQRYPHLEVLSIRSAQHRAITHKQGSIYVANSIN